MNLTSEESYSLVHYTADVWEHVCPLLRVTAPAKKLGWDVIHGNEWQNGTLQVFPDRVTQGDFVLIQRDFPRHRQAYESMLSAVRQTGKPLIYEIDDLLFDLPPDHPDYDTYLPARAAILRAIVEAGAVLTSTPALGEAIRIFNPNTFVQPNYLNDDWWSLRPQSLPWEPGKPVIIGFMGGHSHSYDLDVATPALLRILERYGEKVTLKLWGLQPPPQLRGKDQVEWIDVSLGNYREFAGFFNQMACDIFIAPLQDNRFNHCKSHLKYLEYSALAVPGVYSHITPYQEVIVNGENGFLAGDSAEWEARLAQLVEDHDLRLSMGQTAQETVRRDWLLSAHLDNWAEVYHQAIDIAVHAPQSSNVQCVASQMEIWQRELEARSIANNQAIQEARELRAELVTTRDQATRVFNLYQEVINSTTWHVMERAFEVRRKFVPLGSRRENLAKSAFYSVQVLRREGLGAFLRGTTRRLGDGLRGRSTVPHGLSKISDVAPVPVSITPGVLLPRPALSLLLICDEQGPPVDPYALETWRKGQTAGDLVEIVIWDRLQGRAHRLAQAGHRWQAADLPAVLDELQTEYICVASTDMLAQPETYLEENLVALATNGLAFTINVNGPSTWLVDCMQKGMLPGTQDMPLLRMVVARNILRHDFTLDLEKWSASRDGFAYTAGRVIEHLALPADSSETLPCQASLPEMDRLVADRDLLVRTRQELPWTVRVLVLHPVETVLPELPALPDERPTVLLLLQYLAVGGAEQLHLNLIKNLKDEIRFVVITVDEHNWALGTLAQAFRQETPFVYTLPQFVDRSVQLSYLEAIIRRFDPVSLYIGNGADWIYDQLGRIKKRHPKLRTINQVYDHQIGWINRYNIELAAYLDGHIGASRKICQAYIDRGARPEGVYQIEHSIDPSGLDPSIYSLNRILEIKRNLGLPLDRKVIAFASRLHPQKRPLDFVELARRFASDPSVIFLLIGEGPLEVEINTEIARLGLPNLIHRPFHRPIADVLAVMDVLVLPSEYEGMPLIIAESQIMGKPVVVTDAGNNREVLEITGGGVVIEQIGDVGALARGVQSMLETPPPPDSIRRSFIAHYGIEVISRKYKDALLGGHHA